MQWQKSSRGSGSSMPKRRNVRNAAIGSMLIAAGLVLWLLLDDSGSNEKASDTVSSSGAEIVSVESLRSAAEETPIYWAGPPEGSELELSQPSPDRTYVRYLTGGVEAGDPQLFLTVGSYRLADPVAALRGQGGQPDGVLVKAQDGGTVYFSKERPESVYLAYPGTETQIEVYAPDFQEALELATSGRIVPVE
jgi:hypothetical protein